MQRVNSAVFFKGWDSVDPLFFCICDGEVVLAVFSHVARVQTPMSGHIHPDEVSLNKTLSPYQLRVRWAGGKGGVTLHPTPHSDLPRGARQKETFP